MKEEVNIVKFPTLKFENLTFKEGLNLTVRYGDKWLVNTPYMVAICDKEGEPYRVGFIEKTISKPFRGLVDEDLELEHDPSLRNTDSLRLALNGIYPEFKSYKDRVALVYFRLCQNNYLIEVEK